MKKLKVLLMMGVCVVSLTTMAMEYTSDTNKLTKKQLQAQFAQFVTIEPSVLVKIISKVPLKSYWGCDKVQCVHVLAWAHMKSRISPLPEFDDADEWRIGKEPSSLSAFINERLPSDFDYHTTVFNENNLRAKDLFEIVKTNIQQGLPLLAYHIENCYNCREQTMKSALKVSTIVGYREDLTSQLLVLGMNGQGIERLSPIDVDQFVSDMNTEYTLMFLSVLSPSTGRFSCRKPGQVKKRHSLSQSANEILCRKKPRTSTLARFDSDWNFFNWIAFANKDKPHKRKENKNVKERSKKKTKKKKKNKDSKQNCISQ